MMSCPSVKLHFAIAYPIPFILVGNIKLLNSQLGHLLRFSLTKAGISSKPWLFGECTASCHMHLVGYVKTWVYHQKQQLSRRDQDAKSLKMKSSSDSEMSASQLDPTMVFNSKMIRRKGSRGTGTDSLKSNLVLKKLSD